MKSFEPSPVSESRELLPGIVLHPQIANTAAGPVELDLTEGGAATVLSVHGGIGGCDQGRIMAAWIDTQQFRILSPSRPG